MRNFLYFTSPYLWCCLVLFWSCISKCESSKSIMTSNFSKIAASSAEGIPESLFGQTSRDVYILSTTSSIINKEETAYATGNWDANRLSQNSIPLPKGYNKLEIPVERKDGSVSKEVRVGVSIFIRKILDIDEKREIITLDSDLRIYWMDWNIHNYIEDLGFIDPESHLPITSRTVAFEGLSKIWKPDIFIDEMDLVQRSFIIEKLVTLKLILRDRGNIVYTSRDTIKLRCTMDFQYFPADTQTCHYHIRSYSHNETYLLLRWAGSLDLKRHRGVFLNDPSDPNFSILIEGVKPGMRGTRLFISEGYDRFRKGNYSALKFSIKIRRELSYHIVQTYLPSTILILITWLCFLLPTNMVEARIGISMTTLLTLTAMFSSVRQLSPEVSYTMAIDIWMVFCILCVFVALLVFTLIYWMKAHLKKSLDEKTISQDALEDDLNKTLQTYKKIVRFSKVYAFWALAFAFLTFFFCYWSWLLVRSGYSNWHPDPNFNADPFNKATKLYHCSEIDDNSNSSSIRDC